MKICWLSNAPFSSSGYGVQSELFAPRVAAEGHDVAFLANWGIQGKTIEWNGHHIYPADGDWGNRTMAAFATHHADQLEDCLIIALCDAWVLRPDDWPKGVRMACWAPVDSQPIPQPVRKVLAHPSIRPIAMSRFGEREMAEAGLEPLYVPHGVDTAMFSPAPERKAEIRRSLAIDEDAFVVGMVAANRGRPIFNRKAFPQVMQAFAIFRETHRDAILYLHTNEKIEKDDGMLLRPLANACGLPRRSVRITDPLAWELGVKRHDVADLYRAFDVLANPSFGEGFGVPIIEAQACGVPVIANNWTSMPELMGAGWLVDGDRWYNGPQDSWFKVPTVDSIVAALEHAYASRGDTVLANNARQFALDYDADRVFDEYWRPVLDELTAPREVPPLDRELAAA